jgi:hypothetical protein
MAAAHAGIAPEIHFAEIVDLHKERIAIKANMILRKCNQLLLHCAAILLPGALQVNLAFAL